MIDLLIDWSIDWFISEEFSKVSVWFSLPILSSIKIFILKYQIISFADNLWMKPFGDTAPAMIYSLGDLIHPIISL